MPRLVVVSRCASFLAFLLPTVLHGQDDPTISDARREASSLFQDVAANWQQLENYDVLIVEKHQPMGDSSGVSDGLSLSQLQIPKTFWNSSLGRSAAMGASPQTPGIFEGIARVFNDVRKIVLGETERGSVGTQPGEG